MENWYDKAIDLNKGWDCPSCGAHLPSGIVGISSHWAECGGKEKHQEILAFFDSENRNFEDLKEILNK